MDRIAGSPHYGIVSGCNREREPIISCTRGTMNVPSPARDCTEAS